MASKLQMNRMEKKSEAVHFGVSVTGYFLYIKVPIAFNFSYTCL